MDCTGRAKRRQRFGNGCADGGTKEQENLKAVSRLTGHRSEASSVKSAGKPERTPYAGVTFSAPRGPRCFAMDNVLSELLESWRKILYLDSTVGFGNECCSSNKCHE
jgi:hypothetical protein